MPRSKYYNLSIRNLANRLRKFRDILDEELEKEIMAHQDEIVALIAHEQLFYEGATGRGVEIASFAPYAPRTIRNKQRKGQPYDRVTLRDTGKFHGSLHLEFDNEGFLVVSEDPKSKYLTKKYGKDILRLSDENLKYIMKEFIRPEIQKKFKERFLNG